MVGSQQTRATPMKAPYVFLSLEITRQGLDDNELCGQVPVVPANKCLQFCSTESVKQTTALWKVGGEAELRKQPASSLPGL